MNECMRISQPRKQWGGGQRGGEEGPRTPMHPQAKNLTASHTENRAIMLESSLSLPPEDKDHACTVFTGGVWRA